MSAKYLPNAVSKKINGGIRTGEGNEKYTYQLISEDGDKLTSEKDNIEGYK